MAIAIEQLCAAVIASEYTHISYTAITVYHIISALRCMPVPRTNRSTLVRENEKRDNQVKSDIYTIVNKLLMILALDSIHL